MFGSVPRGAFPKLAYRLGRGEATGDLLILEASRVRHALTLRRGYLCGSAVVGCFELLGARPRDDRVVDDDPGHAPVRADAVTPAQLDVASRRQTEARLARLCAMDDASWRFEPLGSAARARGGRPFSLTTWARRHLEAQLDSTRARILCAEWSGARLSLRKDLAPDAPECDDTDRRILDALVAPRRLDELERAASAPRLRLYAFVWFLWGVGALEPLGVAAPARDPSLDDARRALGLPLDADGAAARRAYLRLARRLRPDANPSVDDEARRALSHRLAEITRAYHSLVRSS